VRSTDHLAPRYQHVTILIKITSQFHPLQNFQPSFQYRLSYSTSLYPNFPYIFSACPLNIALPFFNFSSFNVRLRHISPQLLLCLLLISLPPMAGQNLYKNFRTAPAAPRTHIFIMWQEGHQYHHKKTCEMTALCKNRYHNVQPDKEFSSAATCYKTGPMKIPSRFTLEYLIHLQTCHEGYCSQSIQRLAAFSSSAWCVSKHCEI